MSSDLKLEIVPYFEWCTNLPEENQFCKSPEFFLYNENEWYFELNHDCRNKNLAYRVYLKLKTKRSEVVPHNGYFIVGFKNETILSLDKGSFTVREPARQEKAVWIKNASKLEENLPDDFEEGNCLKFRFYFHDIDDAVIRKNKKIGEKAIQTDLTLSTQNQVEALCSDLGKLIENMAHSDVKLQCKDGFILAHKAILAARSKLFADIFMTENMTESEYVLGDTFKSIEKSAMKLCLEYIYTGKISNLPTEMVPSVYSVGYLLKMPSLMNMCADLMISDSPQDNYASYMQLATEYDDLYFQRLIIDYIANHAKNLISKLKI